jgi:hypothetical protein
MWPRTVTRRCARAEFPSGWTGRGKPATVPHSINRPRGRYENVDPDYIRGTGFIGRRLIPLLAKRGEGDRLHGHQSEDRGFSEYGKQVRIMRSTMS